MEDIVLAHEEVVIVSLLLYQLFMGACFIDLPMIDMEDAIGLHNRGQSVGDDEGGSALQKPVKGHLQGSLGPRVDG